MKEGRDFWYQDLMRDASCECEPEWMDAEDPLFMLYTRYKTTTCIINSEALITSCISRQGITIASVCLCICHEY